MNNKENKKEVNDVKQALFGFNDSEPDNKNFEMDKLVDTWLDKKYIHRKTRLNGNQVIVLTIIVSLAEKYKIKCLKKIIDKFVTYKISEGGQSAKELVDILKNRVEVQTDESLLQAIQPFIK